MRLIACHLILGILRKNAIANTATSKSKFPETKVTLAEHKKPQQGDLIDYISLEHDTQTAISNFVQHALQQAEQRPEHDPDHGNTKHRNLHKAKRE